MILSVKPGVRIRGISNEILLAINVAQSIYADSGEAMMTITSLTDGRHNSGSLHHTGEAVDLRLPKIVDAKTMRDRLSAILHLVGYDVVLEATHIHIEYDPK